MKKSKTQKENKGAKRKISLGNIKEFFCKVLSVIKTKAFKRTAIAVGVVAAFMLVGYGAYTAAVSHAYGITNFAQKDKTKDLGSSDNPYTILEIVPDSTMAQVGYLVDGCEPVDLDTIADSKKTNSEGKTALDIYKAAYATANDDEETVATVNGADSKEATYCFANELPARAVGDANTRDDLDDASEGNGYSEYGYYTYNESGVYTYNTEYKAFAEYDSTVDADKQLGRYNWVCLGYFKEVASGAGTYSRVNTRYSNSKDATQGETITYDTGDTNNYDFTSTSKADTYDFSLIADVVNGTCPKIASGAPSTTSVSIADTVTDDTAAYYHQNIYYIRTERTYCSYKLTGIVNNDLLIRAVANEATVASGYNCQVVTVTPSELNADSSANATYLINNADMIVVHDMTTGLNIYNTVNDSSTAKKSFGTTSSTVSFADNDDINENIYKAIIAREASGIVKDSSGNITSKPAALIIDKSSIASNSNLEKMYNVLNTDGAKYYYNVNQGRNTDGTASGWSSSLTTPTACTKTGDVVGTSRFVYTFENDNRFTKSFNDSSVIEKDTNNSSAFTMLGITGSDDETVTMSTADMMEAISRESYGENQPTEMNILELEATNQFVYNSSSLNNNTWVSTYLKLFPWYIGSDADIAKAGLNVTTQTTYQFDSKTEDININYNIVYIGDQQTTANGSNGYNDKSLGKQIYTAVGDLITTSTSTNNNVTYGWRSTYWQQNYNSTPKSYRGTDAGNLGLRYTGNDITKKKYDELLNFAKTHMVVLADSLYSSDGKSLTNATLDTSSFVYLLGKQSKNINSDSDYAVYRYTDATTSKAASKTVSQKNVDVSFSTLPKEYTEKTSNGSLVFDSTNTNNQTQNGNNVLKYEFTIDGQDDVNYGVGLYIDQDGNGTFEGCITNENERLANGSTDSDSEKSSTAAVYDVTAKRSVETDGDLVSGHTYTVTRIVPSTETGLVPWQIEIYRKDDNSDRYVKTGYTRIKSTTATAKTIKVLQMNLKTDMTQNAVDDLVFDQCVEVNNDSTIVYNTNQKGKVALATVNAGDKLCCVDYTKDAASSSSYYRVRIYGTTGYIYKSQVTAITDTSDVGVQFRQYMNQITSDFKVEVEYMSNKVWYQKYANDQNQWEKDIMDYDMIIIGFCDSAKFTENSVYLAGFNKFKDEGKSIILSHDLTQDPTFNDASTCYYQYRSGGCLDQDVSYYLRKIGGQVRKYYNINDLYNSDGTVKYSYSDYYTNGTAKTFLPSDDKNSSNYLYMTTNVGDRQITAKDYNYNYDENKNNQTSFLKQLLPLCQIQDNSNRAACYYARTKSTDKLDRTGVSNLTWKCNAVNTTKVKAENDGQITKYPFDMTSLAYDTNKDGKINVAETHTQNYALDLNYIEDGDVTVWYNLTSSGKIGTMYSAREDDGANNYYIYTAGNVTYTGLGDSLSMKPDEIKLFVNTMIAAYRSGGAEPYISVTNKDVSVNGDTTTVYVEERDDQTDDSEIDEVSYKINDDTLNTKIIGKRKYGIKINTYVGNKLTKTDYYLDSGSDSDGQAVTASKIEEALSGESTDDNPLTKFIDVASDVATHGLSEAYSLTPKVKDCKKNVTYKITLFSTYPDVKTGLYSHETVSTHTIKIRFLNMYDLY